MEVDVSGIFKMSLKAYQLAHLIYYMNNLCKVSEAVEKYLIKAVIDKWAHSHFDESMTILWMPILLNTKIGF